VLGDNASIETYEVRGSARIEQHFVELQKALKTFGFEVITDAAAIIMSLHKRADGSVIEAAEKVWN
jgi:hypothetical protein